jgi:hypothetical protein
MNQPTCLLCRAAIEDTDEIALPVLWVDGEASQWFTHERCWETHPARCVSLATS